MQYVLNSDLKKFAHSCARCTHSPYHEKPLVVAILEQLPLDEFIFFCADNIVGKREVLHLDQGQCEIALADIGQELVD